MERNCRWIKKAVQGEIRGTPVDKYVVIQGVSSDSRKIKPNQLFVPLIGENFDGHHFIQQAIENGAAATLWQSDHEVPSNQQIPFIIVPDILLSLHKLARAYRKELGVKVIGITGSNGKTTTKDLVASVLSSKFNTHKTVGNLNNHIGVPLTILEMKENTGVAVIEMGMNHFGEIKVLSHITEPDIAIITNIGESHIEFLESRRGIAEAKLEIIEGLKEEGILIYHGDDPLLREKLKGDLRKHICVGWQQENDLSPSNIEKNELKGYTFHVNNESTMYELALLGKHNVLNSLFAIAVGQLFTLTEDEIKAGLEEAKLTGMRLELNTSYNGMKVINDTYNASPTSVKSSVELLSESDSHSEKWVLLGDMNELGSKEKAYHHEIGRYVSQKEVTRIYTIGERGQWILEAALEVSDMAGRILQHFSSKEEAVDVLLKESQKNVILLIKGSRALKLDEIVKSLVKGK